MALKFGAIRKKYTFKTEGNRNECTVCHRTDRMIAGHHLTYSPELVIFLCQHCHWVLHQMNNLPLSVVDLFVEWIKKYGTEWKGGSEKYKKSEYFNSQMNMKQKSVYKLSAEFREKRAAYVRKYRAENKERLNAMERQRRNDNLEHYRKRAREWKRKRTMENRINAQQEQNPQDCLGLYS